MRKLISLTVLAATFFVTGMISDPPAVTAGQVQQKRAVHRFRVGKLNNKWKVYDSGNANNRVITASAGETVVWSATGSDVFFQFPDSSLFDTDEVSVTDGKDLSLTVSANAKPGRYTYSIFCAKEGKFATGDSPPVIIIK